MPKKIKLLWDFRGPEAFKIAEHHCIHLREYAEKEKIPEQKKDQVANNNELEDFISSNHKMGLNVHTFSKVPTQMVCLVSPLSPYKHPQ